MEANMNETGNLDLAAPVKLGADSQTKLEHRCDFSHVWPELSIFKFETAKNRQGSEPIKPMGWKRQVADELFFPR